MSDEGYPRAVEHGGRAPLDQRVGLLAVALAREPGADAVSVAPELVRTAEGNQMALLRALGRLQGNDSDDHGPLRHRAVAALRLALTLVTHRDAARDV